MTGKQSLNIIQKNSSAVITAIKPAQQLTVKNVSQTFVEMNGILFLFLYQKMSML